MGMSAAEKQRRYREKRKLDSQRDAAYREKQKERNARRRKISGMNPQEQRHRRREWRSWDTARRQKKMAEDAENWPYHCTGAGLRLKPDVLPHLRLGSTLAQEGTESAKMKPPNRSRKTNLNGLHKKCFIPGCTNEDQQSLVMVPKEPVRRKQWFEASGQIYSTGMRYCCHDHFSMPEDAENWLYHRTTGARLRLKPNALPHLRLGSTLAPEETESAKNTAHDRAKKSQFQSQRKLYERGVSGNVNSSTQPGQESDGAMIESAEIIDLVSDEVDLGLVKAEDVSDEYEANSARSDVEECYIVVGKEGDCLHKLNELVVDPGPNFIDEIETMVEIESEALPDFYDIPIKDEPDPLAVINPYEPENVLVDNEVKSENSDGFEYVGLGSGGPKCPDPLSSTAVSSDVLISSLFGSPNVDCGARGERVSCSEGAEAQPLQKRRRVAESESSSIDDSAIACTSFGYGGNSGKTTCCTIERIIKLPFVKNYSSVRKTSQLVSLGRPKNVVHPFLTDSIYRLFDWITGCQRLGKIYCWHCLFFSQMTSWAGGLTFTSKDDLMSAAHYHELSSVHKVSVSKMKFWEKIEFPKPVEVDDFSTVSLTSEEFTLEQTNPDRILILLQKQFSDPGLLDSDMNKVVEAGRLCSSKLTSRVPPLKDLRTIYSRVEWLCGCEFLNRFFCWPCLLFTHHKIWSPNGIHSLAALRQSVNAHQQTQAHLGATLHLDKWKARLKETEADCGVDSESLSLEDLFLKRLIECVVFTKQQLNNFLYRSNNHAKLVDLLVSTNPDLIPVLTENNATKGLMEFIDKSVDEVSSVLHHLMNESITREIFNAAYVVLMLEDVVLCRRLETSHIAVILRFVNDDGVCVERFVTMICLDSSKHTRTRTVIKWLNHIIVVRLNCADKIVGYCYNGFALTYRNLRCLNSAMKRTCKSAVHFFYKKCLEEFRSDEDPLGYFELLYIKNPSQLSAAFLWHKDRLAEDFPTINIPKLEFQLTTIRRFSTLNQLSLGAMLKDIIKYKMSRHLDELVKFMRFALVLPKTKAESASASEKICDYAEVCASEQFEITDLFFYVEKDLLASIGAEPDFPKNVALQIIKHRVVPVRDNSFEFHDVPQRL